MGIPICGACRRPIEERVVTALGKNWHVEHFVCAKCEKPFLGHRHYEKRGLAYCETHYHQLFGNLCFVCNQVIAGDGKLILAYNLIYLHFFVCSSIGIFFSSFHRFEQGMVRSPFLMFRVRHENESKVEILRIWWETSVQKMLRKIPNWAQTPFEIIAWKYHEKADINSWPTNFPNTRLSLNTICPNGNGIHELSERFWVHRWKYCIKSLLTLTTTN